MLPYEKQLDDLERFDTRGAFALSLYVHTDPARDSGRNRHAQLEALRRQLESEVNGDKHAAVALQRNFDDAVRAIESLKPPGRATAAFVCADGGLTMAVPLHFPMTPQAFWDDHLHLQPLRSQINEHERALVMLLDKKRLTLYRIFMGEIEQVAHFVDELPRGRDAGGRARETSMRSAGVAVAMGYGALKQEHHHMMHVRQHIDRAIEALQDAHNEAPVDRILVSATPEARTEFMRMVPRRFRGLIHSELHIPMHATPAEVLAAAMAAQESVDRQSEDELIDALLESLPLRAVLGAAAVGEAVADRKVLALVHATDAQLSGSECESCGLLMPGALVPCTRCDGGTRAVEDLLDLLIIRTLQQRGRVEEVRGPATERLREHEGVGALLRFA
ncbi:MAG: baeRF10 domain-containing protein [Gemmatimonadota bacterium]